MTNNKRYRECMAEIVSVLQKYDMAGAITVVDKERAMFRYQFPSWSCIVLGEDQLRFRAKREDYPSPEAQKQAIELSAHIVLQIRDIAANTFDLMEKIHGALAEKFEIEHKPFKDFDPERSQ
jgi:hypothetical protein